MSKNREIASLALPALGGLVADPLLTLVDTAFVGRLGPVALGALGVNAAVFGLASWVFVFLAYGTTPLVAEAEARGDRAGAAVVAVQAGWLALGLGTVVGALLVAFAPLVLAAMGAMGPLEEAAGGYLRLRAFAMPAVLLVTAGNGVFRGLLDTRTPFALVLGMNAVNLVLDPVLIFGLGMGLTGAAVATLIASWVGAVAFVGVLARRLASALPPGATAPDPSGMAPLVRIGGEMFVRGIALVGTLTAASAVATRIGVVAIAAHQVAIQLWLFLAYVTDALAVAAQALVARELGAGRVDRARAFGDRITALSLGLGVVLAGLLALGWDLAVGLLVPDPSVQAALAPLLWLVVLLQPLNAVVFAWDGVFMGARRFRWLAVGMVAAALAGLPLVLAPPGGTLFGVWLGIGVFMVARAVGLGLGYRGRWGIFERGGR